MEMSPGMPCRISIVALALFALTAVGSHAQQAPLAFGTEIEQVTVDVVVTDEEGRPVTDLAEADVEVYEDGALQANTSFGRFEAPRPAAGEASETPVASRRVSANGDVAQGQGRTFVIVFDDVHLTKETAEPARAAVADFLTSGTVEGDRVTLVAPGAGVWWSARVEAGRAELLEILGELRGVLEPDMQPDRLTDYEAMRIYHYGDTDALREIQRKYVKRGMDTGMTVRRDDPAVDGFLTQDPYITQKAVVAYNEVNDRNLATLGAMERALDSLASRPGRKSLILVSEGFIHDPKLEEFKRIVTASLRANTAIYFLYSHGLSRAEESLGQGSDDEGPAFSEEVVAIEGAVSLARDSGGFTMRHAHDLAPGLKRIGDDSRACYLVGYTPANTRPDGKFRQIEVRVPGRTGVEIRARRGYWVPSEEEAVSGEEPEGAPELQMGLDSPYALDEIGLRITHFVRGEAGSGASRVSVVAEVDPRDLAFESRDGQDVAALQFMMAAMNRRGGDQFRHEQKVDLELTPETRQEITRTWLPILRDFELEAGSYRVKVVLKDALSGRLGTVAHDFEIPEPDPLTFRVSTPVLSDMRAPGGEAGERLAIIARREFQPAVALFCYFEVFGAARIEGSGRSRVTVDYEVRRSDGVLYTRQGPSPVEPAADGSLSPMIGFPLRAAPPGDYAITVRVKDGLTGRTVDLREPFTVID